MSQFFIVSMSQLKGTGDCDPIINMKKGKKDHLKKELKYFVN